jgi:hypothetical protein
MPTKSPDTPSAEADQKTAAATASALSVEAKDRGPAA